MKAVWVVFALGLFAVAVALTGCSSSNKGATNQQNTGTVSGQPYMSAAMMSGHK
jgi:hypothetical protein